MFHARYVETLGNPLGVSVVNTLGAFGFRTENYTTYSIHYKYIWINYMNVSFVLTYIDIKVH